MNRTRKKRIQAVIIIVLIFTAWILGYLRSETSLVPYIRKTIPGLHHVVRIEDGLYKAWADEAEENLSGYIALGRAKGYGGPLIVAVAVDSSGKIMRTVIADHKETPAWMSRVLKRDLLSSLKEKKYSDSFKTGIDLDAVTGATATSKAIAEAAANGARLAAKHLMLPVKKSVQPDIIFGIPEVVLIVLFAVAYLGHRSKPEFRRKMRWLTMLTGMVLLGFIYNSPFTLVHVSRLITGYLPHWQTDLYWYILTFGVLVIFIIKNRNVYCEWFCPFGAAQECMSLISRIKLQNPEWQRVLKILPKTLALAALILGLYFRNPGLSNYELYGSLFSFVGTSIQFAALGLVLIAAMFITRPWCSYLCPIKPVLEIIHVFRRWIKEIWKTRKRNTKNL